MRRRRGRETAVRLAIERHNQKPYRRPFTEHKKSSGWHWIARMKKAGKWSYQLDKSTDTGKNSQLMVYVGHEGDMDLQEEFLFCTPLTTTATGADIFNVVDNFQQKEGIGKTLSAYAPTALPLCLVHDTGLLQESGKSILVSKSSIVFCTVKTLLRNICLWIFRQ